MSIQKLKDSALWQDNVLSSREYPTVNGSMMEAMVSKFLAAGGGMGWIADGTLSEWGDRLLRGAYKAGHPEADPALNPLYAHIPAIDNSKFLNILSLDYEAHDLGLRVAAQSRYDISSSSPVAGMPVHADIHHIAGAAMVLKHYMAHPERLSDYYPREGQVKLARECLNKCFEIVVLRGAEDGFIASCAEFAAAVDEMTAITPHHEEKMKAMYEDLRQQFAQTGRVAGGCVKRDPKETAALLRDIWLKDGPKPE